MVNLDRFRSRSQRRYYRLNDKPTRERHYLSVAGNIVSSIFFVLALAFRDWATGTDAQCTYSFGLTQVVLKPRAASEPTKVQSLTVYYSPSQQVLISCILSVVALILLSSFFSVVISAGYPRVRLEFLRHYSVFNVVSILCIVLVAGLWLAVVEGLPKQSSSNNCWTEIVDQSTNVKFGYAYYLFLTGGVFTLISGSFNLLCSKSVAERRRRFRVRLRQQRSSQVRTNATPGATELTDHPPTATESADGEGTVPPAYTLTRFSEDAASDSTSERPLVPLSEPLGPPEEEPGDHTSEPTTPPPPYTP